MALHFYSFICMQENNCALSNLMMNDDSFSVNVWKLLSSGLNFSVFPFFVSEMSSKKKKRNLLPPYTSSLLLSLVLLLIHTIYLSCSACLAFLCGSAPALCNYGRK